MDFRQLNPQDLLQLQSLINCIQHPTDGQGSVGSTGTTAHPIISATTAPASHLITPATISPHLPVNPTIHSNTLLQPPPNPDSAIRQTSAAPASSILPYQSVHAPHSLPVAPWGHSAPATALSAAGLMQPFLGCNSLAISMAGQINQEHQALAAAHLPRWQTVTACGAQCCVCGPAITTPSLACGPSINDCLFNAPDEHGSIVESICIKIKVYPQRYVIESTTLLVTDVVNLGRSVWISDCIFPFQRFVQCHTWGLWVDVSLWASHFYTSHLVTPMCSEWHGGLFFPLPVFIWQSPKTIQGSWDFTSPSSLNHQ